ncbi:uncharacterized protein LOC107263820 isoform X4 [Cephus cinctus]|uniref:Uncharacterized protein LOC107263820 isoform X4 n=1 Tax=Cephus cinctus TaxID=211228 RepID=A0AAJ7R9E2_CEPCN|nr:uncharacterized protein LOC107263820 isoform X4 [Cephus cinctus]
MHCFYRSEVHADLYALRIDLQITMETLYTGAIHGFPHTGGIAGGISNGIAGTLDRDGALSLIVVLGGSLSLVALVFAFITYSLFSDLRSLAGTTLMNLLAALFMVQLLFIVGVGGVQDSELCISLGLSLQYVRVSVVCWLAAMCHHLYATVASLPCCDDAPAYLKYSIFAWGAPMISFGLAILLQRQENHDFWDIHDLTPFNCWYTCSMQLEVKRREKMKRRRALQLVLFLKVNLIIGSVAGCGVAARVWEIPILWAIFCTGHSLQGLAVALSVACNCRVLKVYARKAHKQPKHQIAKSSSMQLLAPPPDPV